MSKRIDRNAVSVMISFRLGRKDYLRAASILRKAKRTKLLAPPADLSTVIRSTLMGRIDEIESQLTA